MITNYSTSLSAVVRASLLFIAATLAFAFVAALRTSHAQTSGQTSHQPTTQSGSRPRRVSTKPAGPVLATGKPGSAPNARATPAGSAAGGPVAPDSALGAPAVQPTPTPTPAVKPTPALKPPDGPGSDDEIITVDTNIVPLNVRVVDRNNRAVDDVRAEDFRIFEDGIAQKVDAISKEEVPIAYGLAIDTSGSLRPQLLSVIDAGKSIIDSNRPGDETMLVRFISSDKIEEKQTFTADRTLLKEVLDDFYTEGGQTAIIDAVYVTAERIAEYKKTNDAADRRRRALILVTDGEDRSSVYTKEQLFQRLREADVQIYCIGFIKDLDKEKGFIRKSPQQQAMNLLTSLATETGGRAYFPESVEEVAKIAQEITHDLRTQYVVSYYPTNDKLDGTFRNVRVTIVDQAGREKRIAVTRNGYKSRTESGTRKPAVTPSRPAAKPDRNH